MYNHNLTMPSVIGVDQTKAPDVTRDLLVDVVGHLSDVQSCEHSCIATKIYTTCS